MPQTLVFEPCCLCFEGMRKGLSNATPEATAIELLCVWLCRVENCRLDGRVIEDQCAGPRQLRDLGRWMRRERFVNANWPRCGEL